MDYVPKDIIIMMFLDYSLGDLFNLCLASSKYNNILCANDVFWRKKLKHDYGKYGHDPSKINIPISWKGIL